jgi:hypothetical protein
VLVTALHRPDDETIDVALEVERLNAALELQMRSALQSSPTAASLVGFEVQAVGETLTEYGDSELADARRLIEEIVSVDATPSSELPELRMIKEAVEAQIDFSPGPATEAELITPRFSAALPARRPKALAHARALSQPVVGAGD